VLVAGERRYYDDAASCGIHSSLDPALQTSTVRAGGAVAVPVRTLITFWRSGRAASDRLHSIDTRVMRFDALDGFDFAYWRPRLLRSKICA